MADADTIAQLEYYVARAPGSPAWHQPAHGLVRFLAWLPVVLTCAGLPIMFLLTILFVY